MNVASEASVLGTPLLAGSGAVLPVGTTVRQGWAVLSMGRKRNKGRGDTVAISDVGRRHSVALG